MITHSKLTPEEKINLIFDYLFNGKKHIEEERFWNELSNSELKNLEKLEAEPSLSFDDLKSSL